MSCVTMDPLSMPTQTATVVTHRRRDSAVIATTVASSASAALSSRSMTVFAASAAALFSISSSAPTPLYRLYQTQFGLTPFILTVIFSAYVVGLLAALLFVGRLSDHIGRRPVIFATLALNAVAMILFIEAQGALDLIEARALQGFATGAATTTLGATILDIDRVNGSVLNSVTAFIGLTLGSLGAGLLVALAPAPTQLVYVLLLALSIAMAHVLILMPETGAVRPGALTSLRPRVGVPAVARQALLLVTPVIIASWALGGFYFSLMPSLVRVATGVTSPLYGGLTVAALTFPATLAVFALRDRSPTALLRLGTTGLALGVALTLTGVLQQSLLLMLLGTTIAGVGFGAAFSGTVRMVLPLAPAGDRAALLAAFYIESYLAFSLPAIAAGLAAPVIGLTSVTLVYGAVVVVLALVSFVAVSVQRSAATA